MGYLNKETVTVDAILTKRGRELLAKGTTEFQISQFAVADDEIDYGLYDLAHPLGTEFYGSAIEEMPVVEASPDETQNLRYKLVTLSRQLVTQINSIPTIQAGGRTSLTLRAGAQSDTIVLTTTAGTAGQRQTFDGADYGYTAVITDNSVATINVVQNVTNRPPIVRPEYQLSRSESKVGLSFQIVARDVLTESFTNVTFYGNQSGAQFVLPIRVTL